MTTLHIKLLRDFGTNIVGARCLHAGEIIEVYPSIGEENFTMDDVLNEINRHVDFRVETISEKDFEVVKHFFR